MTNIERDVPGAVAAARLDDNARTVLTYQISWGAVFAGATVGLVSQTILNMVGAGVGLSTVDVVAGETPRAGTLTMAAGIWLVISGIVAAAIGGYIAGRVSGKPSQSTTAYHGLVSWAVSTIVVLYILASAAGSVIGGAASTAATALGGAGSAIGDTTSKAVQIATQSPDSIQEPLARIERDVRGSFAGQDPAALRDLAMISIKAAISGDPAEQAAATDKAADALAKAQNIPFDQAKSQIQQYQKQYNDAAAKAKEQAKAAADATAKATSQAALFGALALILGALAAFFAGHSAAVPTQSGRPPLR